MTTEAADRPVLLTYAEAAAYLNIPVGTLYAWTREGRVPHVRLGERTVRFRRDALDSWIASATRTSTAI